MRGQQEFVPAKAGVVPAPQSHRESGRCLLEEPELPLPSPAPVVNTRNGNSRRRWHHHHMSSVNLNQNQARRAMPWSRSDGPKITGVCACAWGLSRRESPTTEVLQLGCINQDGLRRGCGPTISALLPHISKSRIQALAANGFAQLHGWKRLEKAQQLGRQLRSAGNSAGNSSNQLSKVIILPSTRWSPKENEHCKMRNVGRAMVFPSLIDRRSWRTAWNIAP